MPETSDQVKSAYLAISPKIVTIKAKLSNVINGLEPFSEKPFMASEKTLTNLLASLSDVLTNDFRTGGQFFKPFDEIVSRYKAELDQWEKQGSPQLNGKDRQHMLDIADACEAKATLLLIADRIERNVNVLTAYTIVIISVQQTDFSKKSVEDFVKNDQKNGTHYAEMILGTKAGVSKIRKDLEKIREDLDNLRPRPNVIPNSKQHRA
jgi:hypothetical protein